MPGWISDLQVSKRNLAFEVSKGRDEGEPRAVVWARKTRIARRYSLHPCLRGRTSEWWLALSASSLYWECDYAGIHPAHARLFGVVPGLGRPFRLGQSFQSFSLTADGYDAIITTDEGERFWRLSGRRKVLLPIRIPGGGEIYDLAGGRMLVDRYNDGAHLVFALDGTLLQQVPLGGDLTGSFVVDVVEGATPDSVAVAVYDLSTRSIAHQWPFPPEGKRLPEDGLFDVGGGFAAIYRADGAPPKKHGIYVLRLATGDLRFVAVPGRVDAMTVEPDGIYYVKNARGRGEIFFIPFA
jgi:hypothetical protein